MSRDVGQALPPASPEFTTAWQAKAPAPPFDRIATRYDALWTTTAIGRAQRNLVWRAIDGLFHAGERILDIGCGTGEDAAHFAARGVHVYATDASPAMVRVARERGITATVCSAEELGRIGRSFDGAISNFGALNCVENLPAVAVSLAPLVRPGGQRRDLPVGPILRVGDAVLRGALAVEQGVAAVARRALPRDPHSLPDRSGSPHGVCARLRIAALDGNRPAGAAIVR